MPIVLVHGVPESAAIWDQLLIELERLGHQDIIILSPPGFGAPIPTGFDTTFLGYREWLVGELEKLEQPVDLIGHDFGGGHVIGVAMTRPDLIRSWTSDIVGMLEPDYEWHPVAQIWQSPKGEEHLEDLFSGTIADRTERMHEMGIPGDAAEKVAESQDEEMARAILTLYRSLAQPKLAEAGQDLHAASARPGLAIIATEDHAVGCIEARHRAAKRASAKTATLEGLGHWWMLENPEQAAKELDTFLRNV